MGFLDFVDQLFRLVMAAIWNKVTENYPGDENPDAPNYAINIPKDYAQEYFPDGLTDYRWNPEYKRPINHLYEDDQSIYDRVKYKYSG